MRAGVCVSVYESCVKERFIRSSSKKYYEERKAYFRTTGYIRMYSVSRGGLKVGEDYISS